MGFYWSLLLKGCAWTELSYLSAAIIKVRLQNILSVSALRRFFLILQRGSTDKYLQKEETLARVLWGHFQAVFLPWVLYVSFVLGFGFFFLRVVHKKIFNSLNNGIFATKFEGHTHHFAICVMVWISFQWQNVFQSYFKLPGERWGVYGLFPFF